MSKICEKCGVETERTLEGKCKVCVKARSAAWYQLNIEKRKAYAAARYAENQNKDREKNAAWKAANKEKVLKSQSDWNSANPTYQSDYRASNKAKSTDYNKSYYLANSEKAKKCASEWKASNQDKCKENMAAWRLNNKESLRVNHQNRRARKKENGGILSKDLVAKLMKLQKGKCPCCGEPLGANYHLDHIVPISLGGANVDSNIQLLRQRCNNQKHAKHPVDFMQQRGFLL